MCNRQRLRGGKSIDFSSEDFHRVLRFISSPLSPTLQILVRSDTKSTSERLCVYYHVGPIERLNLTLRPPDWCRKRI